MSKILIIDDEKELVALLVDELEARSHQVLTAYNGVDGVALAKEQPELIVLDIMMPEMDGFEVCRKIRDEVYISKPFGLRELLARIDANLRREQRSQYINAEKKRTKLYFNELGIDLLEHSVKISGEAIPLSKREYDIVELLALHAGQVFSREHIYERVWGYDLEGDSYTVVEHIRKIRKKFSEVSPDTEYISTVWGIGYKWNRI